MDPREYGLLNALVNIPFAGAKMPVQALPPTPGLHDLGLDQSNHNLDRVVGPMAVSVDHAAKVLGIGATLAWRLIRDKKLKAIKVYGRTIVAVAEIEAFLARGAE